MLCKHNAQRPRRSFPHSISGHGTPYCFLELRLCVYYEGQAVPAPLPVPEVGLSLTLVMRRFCQLRREMPIAQCWLEREVLFFNLLLVTKLATPRTNCLICFYCGTIKYSTVDNKYQNQYFLVKFFFLQKFSARVLCLASLIYLSVTIQVLSGIILETT